MERFNRSSNCKNSNLRHENNVQLKVPRGRFTETKHSLKRKKYLKINQGSNIVRDSFSNRDNVNISVQFKSERQSLYLLLSRAALSIFTSLARELSVQPNKPSWFFATLLSSSNFLSQSKGPRRLEVSPEAHSRCWYKSGTRSHLGYHRQHSIIISIGSKKGNLVF